MLSYYVIYLKISEKIMQQTEREALKYINTLNI